ncbi:MAG: sulfur carrier protein ThiS adenylyltransferase ThiF [Candidatus Cloacimonetes bacterium]|nr:sulfur carrier protein ThiS adenylyltransferase ThiF [Candidatus Cloacimonadota bacterium]
MKLTEKAFFAHHDRDVLAALRQATVGVAGAGGLGSTVALSLARAGVGRLIIVDFDTVEPSNLNRQQYTTDQVGRPKALALRDNLMAAQPFSRYDAGVERITPNNIERCFGDADLLIEAFDRAEEKAMLIEAWCSLHPDLPIIGASGIAGWGSNESLATRRYGNLWLCGDFESELEEGIAPMAPRVGIVANMQANLAIELLVTSYRNRNNA